ncbi:MAG: STAS domain-containing protein [Clostridia bacterium]|nr:STAS domain-containing protein [Clostridia bacterium]
MNIFSPMFFTSLKSYSKKTLVSDLIAGIIVAVIALPLSIALALASGVGPEQGLYTAIIAGFLISFLGGSNVQISGPTAAFATIVAGVVATYGLGGLAVATVLAGIMLILMGIFKLGGLIKFIPYTITTGFTAGIAVTIVVGQLKDFFGLTYGADVKPIETVEKVEAVVHHFGTVNVWAVLVGVLALAVLIIWPKISRKIPGSLIAVIFGIILVKVLAHFEIQVNTIGDLYTVSSALPKFTLPDFSVGMIKDVLPNAFTIAILAAIESLLSCVVADGMTGSKHRSNTELIAQGVGNVGSALFGGIPATGAIARTAANIKNGGKTPVSGIVHAVVLLLVLVLLMPYASLIPMPVIAAILFMVAYNMCQWRPFVHIVKTAPKSDIFVLVLTFVLTVVFDLVVAIAVGIVLACVLFMKRMSDTSSIRSWKYGTESENGKVIPEYIRVYELEGSLFFGSADILNSITFKEYTKCLVLRMRSVSAIDATAMNGLVELYDRCSEKGIKIVISHVNTQPMNSMIKSGFADMIGKDNFCHHIDDAIERAVEITEAQYCQ